MDARAHAREAKGAAVVVAALVHTSATQRASAVLVHSCQGSFLLGKGDARSGDGRLGIVGSTTQRVAASQAASQPEDLASAKDGG